MKINFNSPSTISVLILSVIMLLATIYGIATINGQIAKRSFQVQATYNFPYELRSPDQRYDLPNSLKEISGIDVYDQDRLVAIQDEKAILYVYNLKKAQIETEIDFGKDRDYEDLAITDSTVYVLEMDGDLHQVINPFDLTNPPVTHKLENPFSSRNDTESLCYDPEFERLLIAPKERGLNTDVKNIRSIYAYDLATKHLNPEPLYNLDEYDLGEIIYGKHRRYLFKPSALAIHPDGKHIFVLASVGKLLVVLDRNSELLYIEILDPKLFPQPEGITFTPNGDLLISSEGKTGEASILRFRA